MFIVKLTSYERIMRVFRNEEIDRPVLKLWGAGFPDEPLWHDAYRPVSQLAAEISDLFIYAGQPFHPYVGRLGNELMESYEVQTPDPRWRDRHTILHTPKGDLHEILRLSNVGDHGLTVEHMVKEPEDIAKVLSLPYEPFPVDVSHHEEVQRRLGGRGVVLANIDHAGNALHGLMGSETLAYFSVDCREELLELLQVLADRIYDHAKAMLDAGIIAPYSWVGPELFIPPLMGPDDFRDMVYTPDKRLCDLIHDRGGYVWVHSHGKVSKFMESFIDMGVDVLNPLEPPKNGDVDMRELVARCGNRIGLEGNIEIQELLHSPTERVRELIDACVDAGKDSGRFILCPSAGYMEYSSPSQRYIDNLLTYLRYGWEAVERCR